MRIPELLAPVGSMEHLKVAINAGASSVYLSGKNYGARKFAENFTIEEIAEAVNIAHMHNVKAYITVNTLIRENELENVINYLSKLYSIGVDAVLIQDLGLIELINEYLPDLKVHASTQLTCENQLKLDYLESKGIRRVVLPREMRKEEIENLKTNMELEIFAHGALCYPCDLSLFNQLKEIANLNISCIKIEGRMRSKEYLAIVVSNYRKALNKLKSRKETKSEEISLVFNRGFTEGQFSSTSRRSIRSGHIGLKIGRVIRSGKNQIAIRLHDHIQTMPEKGDGLLIVKNDNDYGFEISQNPIITTLNHFNSGKNKQVKDLTRKNKVLIVKKVWQNRKSDFNLNESEVYLTKRNSLTKRVKEIENKGSSYVKSKLILTFSLKNKFPHLKGRLTLANHKVIEAEVTGDKAFEKPLRKSVSRETIANQLSKTDNYPYEIVQTNINYDGTLFIPISKINELRRNLFEKLESEVISSYRHKIKKIKLSQAENKATEKEACISFYTNNLKHLENLEGIKRVYLEIPPQDDSLIYSDEDYNLNYMISFIRSAFEISHDKDYELIWKWPDITHDKLIRALNKVRGILNKMHYSLPIMSGNFNGDYAFYSTNITNTETIRSLRDYKILTISPELRKADYENIILHCECPEKLELLVQGNVELMKTRYSLLYGKEQKKNYGNFLIDKNRNRYPIHKSISGEELIIFDSDELSLIDEINGLKNLGYSNFSIDGRYKEDDYCNMVNIYREALNGNVNKKELEKYSSKNTTANF